MTQLRFPLMAIGLALLSGSPLDARSVAASPQGTAMLASRLLACMLGHATNLDPNKSQSAEDVTFDGYHEFNLALPAGPVRTTPPPDATEPPEPVNRATRVITDPDGLTRDTQPGFERVIDLWPERVEMTKKINQSLSKLIVVSDVDLAVGTAKMFMTDATDLTTFDLSSTYIGDCHVTTGEASIRYPHMRKNRPK